MSAEPTKARPAATVVITRDGSSGPEVLMLKRSGRAGFFPHAWVFPGGRVDPTDGQVSTRGSVDGLGEERRAYGVAALRETLEEAGAWLGEGTPAADLRARLNAREATLLDAPNLVADLDRLELWAWWTTPEVEPKRYETAFFVVAVGEGEAADAQHDDHETVQTRWVRPVDALAEMHVERFWMAPPTFRTLEEMAPFEDCQALMAAAATRQVVPVMPIIERGEQSMSIVLSPQDRITLRDGRWVSEA
jgi:8-oxo-dGTP pyrophosphatase MutT (NUDIX family)